MSLLSARWVIPAALFAALALRLLWPLADPPESISWSSGVYTDPPANTLPARYAAEHGDWNRVRIPERIVYPLLNGATRVFYELLGVSRRSSEALAALLGVAAVAALAIALRRGPGALAARLGLVLGATCFWLVTYSRFLVAEGVVIALLGISASLAPGGARAQFAAGGAAMIAALLGKFHAVAFLVSLALFLLLRTRSLRACAPAATGGAAVAIVWLAVVFVPHRAEILAWARGSSVGAEGLPGWVVRPADLLLAPFRTFRDAWMFHQLPVIGALGGGYAIWTFSGRDVMRRRLDDGSALFALWALVTFAYYSLLPYAAPRYFLLTALPLVACTACLLAELATPERLRLPDLKRARHVLLLGGWLVFLGFGVTDGLLHYEAVLRRHFLLERTILTGDPGFSLIDDFTSLSRSALWGLVIGGSLFGSLVLAIRGLRGNPRRQRALARTGAAAALSLALAINVGQWIAWAMHRSSVLETTKASLAALVAENAVILGGFAPLLTEGSGVLAVPLFGSWTRADAPTREEVTHVLVARPGGADHPTDEWTLVHAWPVILGRARKLELYRLPDAALSSRYEPTPLEHAFENARAGNWDVARDALADHRRLGGAETPDVLLYEGIDRMQRGETAAAQERLQRALSGHPRSPIVRRNLALLAQQRGDRRAARQHALEGLRFDPKDAELARLLRELTP